MVSRERQVFGAVPIWYQVYYHASVTLLISAGELKGFGGHEPGACDSGTWLSKSRAFARYLS